jgi:hypothetical protein
MAELSKTAIKNAVAELSGLLVNVAPAPEYQKMIAGLYVCGVETLELFKPEDGDVGRIGLKIVFDVKEQGDYLGRNLYLNRMLPIMGEGGTLSPSEQKVAGMLIRDLKYLGLTVGDLASPPVIGGQFAVTVEEVKGSIRVQKFTPAE